MGHCLFLIHPVKKTELEKPFVHFSFKNVSCLTKSFILLKTVFSRILIVFFFFLAISVTEEYFVVVFSVKTEKSMETADWL